MKSAVKAIATTDPVFEFAVLANNLLVHSSDKGVTVFEGLADFVDIPTGDIRFFEVLGVFAERSSSLIRFLKEIEDDYLDEDLRERLIEIVRQMTGIIHPANMSAPWNQIVDSSIPKDNLRLLRSFSRTARHHRELLVFDEKQRKELLAAIEDSIKELDEDKHYPKWAMTPLREGVRRLRFIINHFQIFGHDHTLDHLIKLQVETKYNFDILAIGKEVSDHKLVKTVGLFVLAANLFVLPSKAGEAIPYYRSHIHELMQRMPALIGGPQKLLTHRQSQEDAAKPAEQLAPSSEPLSTDT